MIEIEQLTKQFGDLRAVNDVSLTVPTGEFFVILGPNAAGKTTTIKVMAGLTHTCLLNNPLGEGVNEIIKVFEDTPRLRTLCRLEEGVKQIDWSSSGKGAADVALLSAELKAGRAAAGGLPADRLNEGSQGSRGELAVG